ncbi:MAG: hypothetical protein BGP12_08740 [Rhodospirillales bacterium 70-18]|nr:hypothetical protein [Rhodospirillales bacterium]OJY73180.1 MAG: hypothetical protein BGP12_08740 [Rhodospirillales bacterium 70-18]
MTLAADPAAAPPRPLTPGATLVAAFLARRSRRKLLVVSNCQTFGIVNCMQHIGAGVEADGLTVHEAAGKSDAFYADLLGRYDHVFTVGHLRAQVENPAYAGRMSYLPTIYFPCYHPDLIYASHRGIGLDSPLGGYHSAIALACFLRGLSVADTVRMFNAKTYAAIGYFDGWDQSRDRLFAGFRSLGYPRLEDAFYRWCAEGCFMVSINHPRIRVLHSIAAEALRYIGIPVERRYAEVADNMLNGPIYPVYPEVGECYGVQGDYRFKLPGTNYTLGLEEFVALNFESYRELTPEAVTLDSPYREKVAAITRLLA